MGNVRLQIHNKFGNVKWRSPNQPFSGWNPWNGRTMLCGIDVNHDNKRNVSAVGFCWSINKDLTRFDTCVSFEQRGVEVQLHGAEELMRKALTSYREHNRSLPEHIVVYRDGVSDSELEAVYSSEVRSFFRACSEVGNYEPKMTFLVIQKRINSRMFTEPRRGQVGSAEVGTVIDGQAMSARYWDFLLTSTLPPPKKTATPTRYIVIFDSYKLTSDQIQPFTLQLTAMYYGWQGTVRVPAPCQCAHNIAKLFGTVMSTPHDTFHTFQPIAHHGAYHL